MVKTISAVLGVGALICSALALTLSANDEVARKAAVEWLQLVDAGKYQEAGAQAAQEIRGFEQWLDYLARQRGAVGRANKRKLVEMHHASTVAGIPDVRPYHVIQFKTSFEHKPSASETITIAKVGCCWEIFNYKIGDK